MDQQSTPTYNFSVKLDDALRQPIRRLAFDTNQQIRQIVSDATRLYLKKQKIKEGDRQ
jgi:predicted transcriptional regulator